MCSIDLAPCPDDGENFLGREIGEGEIMVRGKGKDIASSLNGFSTEQKAGEV